MFVKINKFTAFIIAFLMILSSVTLLIPFQSKIGAEENITAITDEASLKAALEGEGGNYSLSADISLTVEEYEEYRYTVTNTVSIDLNGYAVTINNTANLKDNTNDSTLIKIEDKGKLTLSDSSADKSGKLSYIGGIHVYSESDEYVDFKVVTSRNLIYLSAGASLVIEGGSFYAGNTEKEWIHRGAGLVGKGFEFFTGFAEHTVCGTVITASGNSSVTVNGGYFEANGRKRQNILPNLKGWTEERPASVCIRAEAKATVDVNDGSFKGAYGADVFALDATSKSSIKAGKFETTPSTNERIADYMDFAAVNVSTYYGHLNLPTIFIPDYSRKALYQNDAPLSKTADAVDGAPVYLIPNTSYFCSISSSLTSGTYTPGGKGTLSSGYKKYFTSDSTITYQWYAISVLGKVTPLSSSNSTTLDLSKLSSKGLSLSSGSKYSFACVITETYKDYVLTTVSRPVNLDTTNKSILAAVSLTPTGLDDNDNYKPGNPPTFSVPSNANYKVDTVNWYEKNSTTALEAPVSLKDNSTYFVVIKLSPKSNYLFTEDTRVSFLPGATSTAIAPSSDGKSATVSAWINTACSHSETEYIINSNTHSKVCKMCGHVITSANHTYSDWTAGENVDTTVPMSRSCTVCSHKENSAEFAPVDNEKTPIYEVKVDFGTPTEGAAPSEPTIASTPDKSKVLIDSFTWKTSSGDDFTKFEAGATYELTVVYKLANPEADIFSESTLASSLYNSTAVLSLNDDNTELTVKYTVIATVSDNLDITMPALKIGSEIASANVVMRGNATVHWYKDGKQIGYSEIVDGTETDYDFDPDDEIDFLTHVIEGDSVYYVRVNWHVESGKHVDASKVTVINTTAATRSIVGGEFGFATAFFLPKTEDKYIRTIEITGITEPEAGAKVKTTGAKVNGSYTVSSIAFYSGSSKVSSFACGKQYSVKITIAPNSGYTLDVVSATVNGRYASIDESGSSIVVTCTFDKVDHNIDNKNATITPATCVSDGTIVAKCTTCSTTAEAISLPKLGHAIIQNNEVTATCENEGIRAHYICNRCLKTFSDELGETEVTKDSLIVPKDESNHVGATQEAHEANTHYTVCIGCTATLDTPVEHIYSDAFTGLDNIKYYTCPCGHWVPETGPKQPEFVVGGTDEKYTPPPVDTFDFGSFSLDTIKMILILSVIFAVVLIGSIITISIILIVTRDKGGKQLLPDEKKTKKRPTTTANK